MAQSIRHALPLRIIYISMVHLSWRCIACAAPQHENLIWQSWQCPFAALGLQKGVGSQTGGTFVIVRQKCCAGLFGHGTRPTGQMGMARTALEAAFAYGGLKELGGWLHSE